MRITRACNSKPAKYATLNVFSSNEAGVESLYDIFTKTLGFESVNGSKGNEVSVTDGYCKINFWSDRTVSSVRSALGKPNITRLSSIVLHDPESSETNKDKKAHFGEHFPKWKVSIGNNPKVNPEIRNLSHRKRHLGISEDNLPHRPLLKEIVIGLNSSDIYNSCLSELSETLPAANVKFPGIYAVSSNTLLNLRLIPSDTSSLVFHVNNIEEAEEQLNMVNMNGGRIGFTGARVGQLMLKTPLQDGIDIRLCSAESLQPHYNEGERTVYEGVIKGFGDVAHTTQLGCGHVLRKELIGVAMSDKL